VCSGTAAAARFGRLVFSLSSQSEVNLVTVPSLPIKFAIWVREVLLRMPNLIVRDGYNLVHILVSSSFEFELQMWIDAAVTRLGYDLV